MPKYRKKPVVIEATQWFKNGDHPDDECVVVQRVPLSDPSDVLEPFLSEGKVVRFYRHPDFDGMSECRHCGLAMHVHGWIDTLEGGHIVCPGDWIITGVQGEHYPCKPDIFDATYELEDVDITLEEALQRMDAATDLYRDMLDRDHKERMAR